MRAITNSLVLHLLLLGTTATAQTKQQCQLPSSLMGECVQLNDCSFVQSFGDFLNSEILQELRDRNSACSSYGKRLICCEISESSNQQLSLNPVSLQTPAPPQIVQVTTDPTPTRFQGNHALHPKYNLFKDLKCGSSYSNRVANGENANLFEFPWAARLGYDNLGNIEFSCGGTLISDFYVVTAAHCLVHIPFHIKMSMVRLGEYDQSKEQDCDYDDPEDPLCAEPVQDIRVRSYVSHSGFTRSKLMHDIGLVQLDEPADTRRQNIKPICLPITGELQNLPERFVVTGWGRTQRSSSSEILQKASVPLYDQNACRQKLSMKNRRISIGDGQFCAGGEGKVDACRGDSGSALQSFGVWTNDKPRMVLYGVVSYGIATCGVEIGFPGVYTKVPNYLNWILDNVQ